MQVFVAKVAPVYVAPKKLGLHASAGPRCRSIKVLSTYESRPSPLLCNRHLTHMCEVPVVCSMLPIGVSQRVQDHYSVTSPIGCYVPWAETTSAITHAHASSFPHVHGDTPPPDRYEDFPR